MLLLLTGLLVAMHNAQREIRRALYLPHRCYIRLDNAGAATSSESRRVLFSFFFSKEASQGDCRARSAGALSSLLLSE